MTNEAIEKEFDEAQLQWLRANPNVDFDTRQHRYFFFAGSEFGLSAAQRMYNESHERQVAIIEGGQQ